MWAGNLVSARLLARKGIVDPTDFASLLAWRLERGGGIPEEYQTVPYIESTGTQYIDTGVVVEDLTSHYKLRIDMTINGATGETSTSNVNGYMGINGGIMLTLAKSNGFGISSTAGVPWVKGKRYDVVVERTTDAMRVATINGTYLESSAQGNVYLDRPFGIFALSPFDGGFYTVYGKLYSFKAWKNGELIRNFVPCYRKSDGEVGLYDLVTKEFFANAGTGEFICEKPFEAEYEKVEYIRSTGTQYIDTGFKPNNNTRVVMDVEASTNTVVTASTAFFSARDTTADARKFYAVMDASSQSYDLFYQYGSIYTNSWAIKSADDLAIRRIIDANGASATIDGVTKTYEPQTFQVPYNLYLLASNEIGKANYLLSAKLYSCKIYDNGTLVRDLVPCYRKSDGKAGLYDFANSVFYTNAGTGDFVYEVPEVPDEPDVPDEPANPYTWEGVAQNIENGTYKDVYKIGDEVPLDLGSEGVINMQVAAFDVDTLADGSGTAAISWVAKELLPTVKNWNLTAYTEGVEVTGTLGGWPKCYLRDYLNNTVSGLMPKDVLQMVMPVAKVTRIFNLNEQGYNDTNSETLWIPSVSECFDASSLYSGIFSNAEDLKKNYVNSPLMATKWWLRDASDKRQARIVTDGGIKGQSQVTMTARICLCFCTGKSK